MMFKNIFTTHFRQKRSQVQEILGLTQVWLKIQALKEE